MRGYNHKSITDPLYGHIGLSKLEADVVSTPTFQRLHNVRQLGLAHLVFPSAGYSRFSHSIGACHNAGRLYQAICDNSSKMFDEKEFQVFRLAGLLHDIGHYPFSHATEEAIGSFYVEDSVIEAADAPLLGQSPPKATKAGGFFEHEDVGKEILREDTKMRRTFEKHDFSLDLLSQAFEKGESNKLVGVISSELDCDRLDYLMRTAKVSGAPFGNVDADFIISKATADTDGIFCFQEKAAAAIDHLLLGRYFDYMQMVHHKTVTALEWSLKKCIEALLEEGLFSFNQEAIRSLIASGEWASLDDPRLIEHFKSLEDVVRSRPSSDTLQSHLHSVLTRSPAKQVWYWSEIIDKSSNMQERIFTLAQGGAQRTAQAMGLDPSRFTVDLVNFPVTKSLPVADAAQRRLMDMIQTVNILYTGRRKARALVDNRSMMLNALANRVRSTISVFYLPMDGEPQDLRNDIRKRMSGECGPV